jgi:hypothetical protein
MFRAALAVAALLFVCITSGVRGGAAGTVPHDADAYLRKAGFTAAELGALAARQVIARTAAMDTLGTIQTQVEKAAASQLEPPAASFLSSSDGGRARSRR